VDGDNVSSFTNLDHITGVVVGAKSLQAVDFLEVIKNA
jgi:triosephosphate isomerase